MENEFFGRNNSNQKIYDLISKNMHKNEKLLPHLLSEMSNSFFVLNSKCEPIMCNQGTYEIFGCQSEQELIDKYMAKQYETQDKGASISDMLVKYAAKAYTDKVAMFDCIVKGLSGNSVSVNITLYYLELCDELDEYIIIGFLKNLAGDNLVLSNNTVDVKMKAILDVTPLCLNLWNSKFENVMCNKKAVQLFGLENEEEYLSKFFMLSPEYQPNGILSSEFALENIKQAFDKGYCQFNWMHCNLLGEEIPSEITLSKVDATDENGNVFVAGFTRDLRSYMVNGNDDMEFENYFFNHISDKMLFNTLADISGELIFVLDIRTSLIQYYGNGSKIFGIDKGKYRFPEELIELGKIYPDDIETFMHLSDNMKTGNYELMDIRFVDPSGISDYYRLYHQTIYNENNKPIFTIGKAIDINEQKALEVSSTTDLLTNCLNKMTTEKQVSEIVTKHNAWSHALFIIDIDNFKAVNDNLGHHFGDLVLREVAANLKDCFRNSDIVGRIGGDEFIGFIQNVSDLNVLTDMAKRIVEVFKNTYSGEYRDYDISGSVGISCYPNDGTTYEELYKAADKALYQSKMNGKNGYTFYTKELMNGTMQNHTTLENANRMAKAYFDTELISMLFDILYKSNDIKFSLNIALQMFGQSLQADRCYIFESFDNGITYDNTYEWCGKHIQPQLHNLQNLGLDVFDFLFENANEDGLMYSNDLVQCQNTPTCKIMNDHSVKSFVHANLKKDGYVKFILGIDTCAKARVWNEKELNTILYASKIISTFLLVSDGNKNSVDMIAGINI